MAQPVPVVIKKKRTLDDYVVTERLGSGAFAVVWKATNKKDGTQVAIKQFSAETLTIQSRQRVQSEINILSRITHPNVVRLFDVLEDDASTYLILEYCAGGDLATYIREHGRVRVATARRFMQHLGAGLQMLHSINLIHRDLKPENLLLSTRGIDAVLKISDFGLAREWMAAIAKRRHDCRGYTILTTLVGTYTDTVCGSPLYMAPEVLQFQKYDSKADLWRVGAILFQLVTGDTPYHGHNHFQILQSMRKYSDLQFPESILTELDPCFIDLCQKLLCFDPGKRLIFNEFVSHKFFSPV